MSYLYFIGIDISKDFFNVSLHNSTKTNQFPNTSKGFSQFLASIEHPINQYFITLEATGGYETNLLLFLCKHGFAIHRLSTLKSSHYLRSLHVFGKNDILDAQALARFGAERHNLLPIFQPQTQEMQQLQTFRMRRDDLVAMRVTEKQRLQHPNYESLKDGLERVCTILTQEIMVIDKKIAELIDNNHIMQQKKKILTEFKGVGEQTGNLLLAMCPELGNLTRRQIASLAGVAPHPKESGTYQGYRSTKGGRSQIKKALFMAVLSAKSYNPILKKFYDGLISRGKKKMVAMTATMRKMIVILNAKLRDFIQSHANATQNTLA
jgi:transposase